MHQDGVAGAHPRARGHRHVGARRAVVVRRQQPLERRLNLHVVRRAMRIDVEHPAARIGLGFRPRAHGDDLLVHAGNAIGVEDVREDLVLGIGLEVDDAAGEHVGADDVEAHVAQHPLGVKAQPRQARVPCLRSLLAIEDRHRRIVIVIAGDAPLEPEVDQRRRLDVQLADNRAVGCVRVGSAKQTEIPQDQGNCQIPNLHNDILRLNPCAWKACSVACVLRHSIRAPTRLTRSPVFFMLNPT